MKDGSPKASRISCGTSLLRPPNLRNAIHLTPICFCCFSFNSAKLPDIPRPAAPRLLFLPLDAECENGKLHIT